MPYLCLFSYGTVVTEFKEHHDIVMRTFYFPTTFFQVTLKGRMDTA